MVGVAAYRANEMTDPIVTMRLLYVARNAKKGRVYWRTVVAIQYESNQT